MASGIINDFLAEWYTRSLILETDRTSDFSYLTGRGKYFYAFFYSQCKINLWSSNCDHSESHFLADRVIRTISQLARYRAQTVSLLSKLFVTPKYVSSKVSFRFVSRGTSHDGRKPYFLAGRAFEISIWRPNFSKSVLARFHLVKRTTHFW